MPEALVVLGVLAVALFSWLGAWLHTRNPANTNPADEAARLREHVAWLEQRLEVARRENWGGEMISGIATELNTAAGQLANSSKGAGLP